MWWHTVTHGRGSEEETGEWSGYRVPFTLPRNMVYPALLPLMRTPRLPVVDWTDAPADLNGLVRFAERRNLVSARVPSYFNWHLLRLRDTDRVESAFVIANNCQCQLQTPQSDSLDSSWNVMAYGDAREGKWRGNWRMEWVASTFHTTSEHGVSSITTDDAYTSAASSWLNWRPRRFKWARPFRRKTNSGFCACAITFQMQSTICWFRYQSSFWLQSVIMGAHEFQNQQH